MMFPGGWGPFYFSVSSSWVPPGHSVAALPWASPTAPSRVKEQAVRTAEWSLRIKRAGCSRVTGRLLCVSWSPVATWQLGDTGSWLSTRPPCAMRSGWRVEWTWREPCLGRVFFCPGCAVLLHAAQKLLCPHSGTDQFLILSVHPLPDHRDFFSLRRSQLLLSHCSLRFVFVPVRLVLALSCGSLSQPSDLIRTVQYGSH